MGKAIPHCGDILLRDPQILRLMRKLCPKPGSGHEVTITSRGQTATLTAETRRKIEARLRRRPR